MSNRTYNLAPNIAEIARGPWLAEARAVNRALAIAERLDMTAHMAAWEERSARPREEPAGYELQGGAAVIAMDGVMMRKPNSMGPLFGGVVSTIEVERAFALAERDPEARAIVLDINSPGGYIEGTAALASRVARCKKPVLAYAGDLCASAAYWVASQADWISAGNTAELGSVGIYTVLTDSSKADEDEGYVMTTVSSGGFKGLGADGRVTPEYVAYMQERIDDVYAEFKAAVGTGRSLSEAQVDRIADGRVLSAKKAKAARLVDAVETMDAAIARITSGRLPKRTTAPRGAKGEDMSLWDQFKAALGAEEAPIEGEDTPTVATTPPTATIAGPEPAAAAQGNEAPALAAELQALTAERDQLKAALEGVTVEAREGAKKAAIRAFDANGAKPLMAAIEAADLSTAKAMAAAYNQLADKAFGITPEAGAQRTTTVTKLPDVEVHAQDIEGTERPKIDAKAYYEARNKRQNGAGG